MNDKTKNLEEERRAIKDRRDEERRLDERRKYGIGEIAPERRDGPRRFSERREILRRMK